MKTLNGMKTTENKRIIKRKYLYYMLKNIKHETIIKGIQLLTESCEERIRPENDKDIIRFEEDLAFKNFNRGYK